MHPLSLGHGNPFSDRAPTVRIETSPVEASANGPNDESRLRLATSARSLAQHLWTATGHHDNRIAAAAGVSSDDPTRGWDSLHIAVDDRPVRFRGVAVGADWVAIGLVGRLLVSLTARHVEPQDVHLAVVDDVDTYDDMPDAAG